MNGLLRRKARRAVILAGRAIAILALLIAAALGGVVLTLNTPAGRRLVIAETNRAIADTFRGTLEITSVRDVGLGGADDVDLVLRDAQGRVVASAEGVTVRTSVPAIVLAALRGKGDIPVVVSHAFVRRIGATLLRDSDGEPTLAHALEPRHRGHAGESSRGVRVDIRSLRVAELRASGQLASFEHLEARASGLVSSFKANLRSEPPLPQDEILGLLLFGSPEGLGGTPGPGEQQDPTQRAAGLASGVVTQGINQALSGISKVEISTRLDTTQAANPRPEVEVRLSNNVLAHVTVQTGTPAPGEPPDLTLVTIDWRFKPRWSLRSTVGDQGSTLFDLLWRHRY